MTSLRPRFSIRGLIAVVAAYAVIFAGLPPGLAIVLSILLTGLAGLVVGWSAWAGIGRLRAAAWVAAAYPWFTLAALGLTWVAAWVELGHPPWPSRNDPKDIGGAVPFAYPLAAVLLMGGPFAVISNVCLSFAELIRTLNRGGRGKGVEVAGLILVPILSWLLAAWVLRLDPGHVLNWFMD